VTIWVSHKPPTSYPSFPYKGFVQVRKRPDYVIGRSMTETDEISEEWVAKCNNDTLVDEIWVKLFKFSTFNCLTFLFFLFILLYFLFFFVLREFYFFICFLFYYFIIFF